MYQKRKRERKKMNTFKQVNIKLANRSVKQYIQEDERTDRKYISSDFRYEQTEADKIREMLYMMMR